MYENKKMMLEKTAEVYEMHSKAMLTLIPVFERFDGKVIDRRLDTAMTGDLPEGQVAKWKTEYGYLKIGLWNDFSFQCGKYWEYPENRSTVYSLGKYEEVFESTPSGKWRIKAAPIIEALEGASGYYSFKAEETRKVLNNADAIIEGMKERVKELNRYQGQFDYEAMDILGAYVHVSGYSFI